MKEAAIESHDGNFSKKAGNGPSRRHIKGSKIAKGLQVSCILLRTRKTQKLEQIGALKGGTFQIF